MFLLTVTLPLAIVIRRELLHGYLLELGLLHLDLGILLVVLVVYAVHILWG